MKTLKQLRDDLIARLVAGQRSPHTIRMIRHCTSHTLQWWEERHGVSGPDQLNRNHIEAWVAFELARRTDKSLPLARNTLIKQFTCDRGFLYWLEEEGALPTGLSKLIPKIDRDDLLPTSVLTHPQMVLLLEHIDTTTHEGYQMRAMAEFLYSTGVRAAELLALDIHSVDIDDRQVRVFGKGRKERIVPFGITARKFLTNYLSSIRPLRLRDSHDLALWLDRQGSRMPYHTLRRRLIEALDTMRLSENVTAHTFRRSCATVLLRGGANVWHVKEQLGHERVDSLDPYLRLLIDDLRETLEKFHPREKEDDDEQAAPV